MKKVMAMVNLILALLVLVISISAVTYAWFSYSEKTQPIMFYVSSLKVESKLYYQVNLDYNGEYDLIDDENNEYIEVLESMTFLNVIPGQIYTFKLVTRNKGTIDGFLNVDLELNASSNLNMASLTSLIYQDPVSNINVDKHLYVANESLVRNLFLNKPIEFYEENKDGYEDHVFFFHIRFNGTIGNAFTNQTLTIKQLIIRLDQIEDQH